MREVCERCRRPASVCYCAHLPRLASRTRVVFLQHARERRVAVGTARMAHLSLENSELHVGVDFSELPRVTELAQAKDACVLFPGEGAMTPEEARSRGLNTLVVVDGTWPLARKLLKVNPFLARLPRVGFTPKRPGNYRIRKEPAEHCVSTIEAVVEVLDALEGAPGTYAPMLKAFDVMVEQQIAHTHLNPGTSRYLRHKRPPRPRIPAELSTRWEDLVLVYAEANAQAKGTPGDFVPELVHWVARRPATGEAFEALVQSRRPLGENVPLHLELSRARFDGAEPIERAKVRFLEFTGEGDLWAAWGGHALTLLKAEGLSAPEVLDVRLAASRFLRGRAGDLDALAERWGGGTRSGDQGRAGRRLAALACVVGRLRRELGVEDTTAVA